MISVGRLDFFPERMVFVPKTLSLSSRGACFARYPILDCDETNKKALFSNDARKSSFFPERITHVGFSLSANCNLRCQYCSAYSTEGTKTAVAEEDVQSFVSDIMKKWVVGSMLATNHPEYLDFYFTGGGEPTYEWIPFTRTVLEIEAKAQSNGIPIRLGITTNGVYGEEQSTFLTKHFHRIMVSYDGLPEIQNRNRISPYAKDTALIAENTIRRLIGASSDLTIRTTIWHEDFGRLEEMADYLFSSFGTSFVWSILPVSPMGRALKRLATKKHSASDWNFLEHYLKLQDYCRQKWPDGKIDSQFFSTTPAHVYCGSLAYATQIVWLLANGNIVTCLEAQDFPTIVGKVSDGKVQYYRTCNDPLLAKAQQMFDDCRDCYTYPFCKGGCPAKALAWESAGSEEKPWECEQTVSFWKYLIESISQGKECFGWKLQPSRYPDLASLGILECIQPPSQPDGLQK